MPQRSVPPPSAPLAQHFGTVPSLPKHCQKNASASILPDVEALERYEDLIFPGCRLCGGVIVARQDPLFRVKIQTISLQIGLRTGGDPLNEASAAKYGTLSAHVAVFIIPLPNYNAQCFL